jgi:hypothetical protein
MTTKMSLDPELDMSAEWVEGGLRVAFGPSWTEEQRAELIESWSDIVREAVESAKADR